jgi:hypothetical protein
MIRQCLSEIEIVIARRKALRAKRGRIQQPRQIKRRSGIVASLRFLQ